MEVTFGDVDETVRFGEKIGRLVNGGEVIELFGDIGAGKTAITKGIARGMEITDDILSPTFTLSRVYDGRDDLRLAHYDFYRLSDAGILGDELSEYIDDQSTVTVIEWADIVAGVLPTDRLTLKISTLGERVRKFEVISGGPASSRIIKELANDSTVE